MILSHKKERRRRLSIPYSILATGILLCLLPFINYFFISVEMKIHWSHFRLIMSLLSLVQINMLFFPLLLGIGLLLIKKWAWWGLLLYFILLLGYDLIAAIQGNLLFNLGAFFRTILGFGLILFFVRKDISAPYFKLYPRGWRGEKRIPIKKEITINEFRAVTRDISPSGIFVEYPDCPLEINSQVRVKFLDTKKELIAGVVNINSVGIGIAFRNLTKSDLDYLKACLD